MVTQRWAGWLLAGAILVAVPAAAQVIEGFPANPGFEDGLRGWTVTGPEGAATVEEGRGAVGRSALTLGRGWVVAEPAAEPLSGWLVVSLRAQPAGGREHAGRLLVGLVASDAPEPRPLAAIPAGAFGGEWRPVHAEVLVPARADLRLALGSDGPGPWRLDGVEVERFAPEPPVPEEPPVFADPLPPGWEPEGILDARERTIAGARELLVSVNGIEVGVKDAVEAPRGQRGALRVLAENRALREKPLTVTVEGPPGFMVPERTVTVRPGGTTIFNASLQSTALGEAWVLVSFSSGSDRASIPVRVTTTAAYPAAGLAWSESPADAELAAALALDPQLMAVRVPTQAAAEALPDLPALLTRLILLGAPWAGADQAASASALPGRADIVALTVPRGAAWPEDADSFTRTLAAAEGSFVLSPPVDLLPGPPPTISDEAVDAVGGLAERGSIAAPTLRLPVLDLAAAGGVGVARRGVRALQPCWHELSAAVNLDAVAAAIRSRATVPLFFGELAAQSSGSPETDALVLARVLAACAYQGSTGFTLAARPADAPAGADAFAPLDDAGAPRGAVAEAFREVGRELSGVLPLRVWSQTAEIGLADDALVGFRPFLRGDDGLLALWNNTGADVDLIFETRTQPLDVSTVAIGLDGITRSYVGAFHYSDEAIALNRPVVFVSLRPGQFKLLTMQLAKAHAGWLGAVEFAPQTGSTRRVPRDFYRVWEEKQIVP